jgi:hypothetical protein
MILVVIVPLVIALSVLATVAAETAGPGLRQYNR